MIVTNTVINYKLTSHVIKKRTNNKISFIEFVLVDTSYLSVMLPCVAYPARTDVLLTNFRSGKLKWTALTPFNPAGCTPNDPMSLAKHSDSLDIIAATRPPGEMERRFHLSIYDAVSQWRRQR